MINDNADTKAQQLMQQARANQNKINKCRKHEFGELFVDLANPNTRLQCMNCGGIMHALHAFYYTCGYKAAGGNPNEIITNFL